MNIIFSDTLEQDVVRDYQAYIYPMRAIHPYLTDDKWQLLLENMSTQSNLLISSGTLESWKLDDHARQEISQGNIIVKKLYDRDEMAVFARVSDTVVIQLSALQVEDNLYFSLLIAQFIAPFGLIALFFLAVMLWQQYRLNKLEKASLKLALGGLDARVPTGWLSVGTINQSFNYMAEKLERMFNSQKHMTTAVSHEFKTPLFRLQMQLSLIRDEPHTEQTGDYLTHMNDDIEEMNKLVRELLSFSKMEREDRFVEVEQIDLAQWLTGQVNQLSQYCHHQLVLAVASDTPVESLMQAVEPTQLKRALDNLVFNADRFARDKIKLSLYLQQEQLCLSVEDDGIGIVEAERERIFEPFARIDSDRNRDSGGFGLGLAIVQEIVRCHGAEISVTKSTLGGACFVIRFAIN